MSGYSSSLCLLQLFPPSCIVLHDLPWFFDPETWSNNTDLKNILIRTNEILFSKVLSRVPDIINIVLLITYICLLSLLL